MKSKKGRKGVRMRAWYILLLLSLSALSYPSYSKTWLDTAVKYLYVRENPHGSNRSLDIDRWNRYVGNALGSSYCGAYAGYCKNGGMANWRYVSGLAQNYYRKAPRTIRHSNLEVYAGKYKPVAGDLVIWGKGETIFGHIGFILKDWKEGTEGWTIEANTSSGEAGSQSNGDGVYKRYRKIYRFQYFRIIGFVHFN